MPKKPEPWWWEKRGAWFVQIDGKRHNLGRNKKKALGRYYRLMTQPKKRRANRESVVGIIDAFLEWCSKHLSPASYEWYRYRLQQFVATISPDLAVGELKPFDVTQWIDGNERWSNGTRRNAIRAVQRAMKWAVEQGLLDVSPVAHMKKPKGGRREVVLSESEFQRVLSLAPDREFRDLISVTWETGCRPQESLRVEARHVDVENSRWVFPASEAKGDLPRAVYLTETALAITKRLMLRHPEGALFRNTRGIPWCANTVQLAFGRIQNRMGRACMKERGLDVSEEDVRARTKQLRPTHIVKGEIVKKSKSELHLEARGKLRLKLAASLAPKYSLYTLRHSWATHALERGVDALTVAILMGHKDPSTLAKVYQHLSHNPKHLLEQAKKAAS